MTYWKNFYTPRTVKEAVEALAADPGLTRFVAGGTDLLLDLQQGRHLPVNTLIDITAIPELRVLEVCDNRLYIGAGVPLNRLVAFPALRERAQALYEACGLIGGPQVRNTATLGGNVAHALPAADGTIALTALGAEAEVAGPEGVRRVPLGELFLGPGRSALEGRRELLVGFWLPLDRPGQASAFRRIMRPQGVAIAILNMAAWVERDGDCIADVRLAAGPSGPTPRRAVQAEEALRGRRMDEQTLAAGLEALLAEARFRTSPHRATAEYRRRMAGVLLQDTLTTAWQRAGSGEN